MKQKSMLLIAVVTTLALLAGATVAFAQVAEPQRVTCATCKYENDWAYKFCINCGASLAAAKEAKLAELQRQREAARQKAIEDSLARVREAEMIRRQHEAAIAARAKALAARDTTKREVSIPAASTEPPRAESPKTEVAAKPQARLKPDRQPWYKTMLREPAVLPRLFNVPTADVLGSLDLYFTGGGAFGIEKERHFLGHAGMGLGDIAEVEFATQSVINSLQQGSSSVATSAFKMLIMHERGHLPAMAMALRGTTSWQYLEGSNPGVSFETRLTKLYIVASKRISKVTGHIGLGLTDVRVRNPQGWFFSEVGRKELQRNIWAPFAGVSIQANPKAQVMVEIEGLPSYDFAEGGSYSGKDIKNIWAGVVGVRFYFTNWLAADTGVRYRSDFNGIADANIQANINMLLPMGRLREAGKSN